VCLCVCAHACVRARVCVRVCMCDVCMYNVYVRVRERSKCMYMLAASTVGARRLSVSERLHSPHPGHRLQPAGRGRRTHHGEARPQGYPRQRESPSPSHPSPRSRVLLVFRVHCFKSPHCRAYTPSVSLKSPLVCMPYFTPPCHIYNQRASSVTPDTCHLSIHPSRLPVAQIYPVP